jgi:hypothetical protein
MSCLLWSERGLLADRGRARAREDAPAPQGRLSPGLGRRRFNPVTCRTSGRLLSSFRVRVTPVDGEAAGRRVVMHPCPLIPAPKSGGPPAIRKRGELVNAMLDWLQDL